MKQITLLITLLSGGISVTAQTSYTNPGIVMADPYVLKCDSIYYLYGTTSNDGFKCWSSKDLVNWTAEGYAYQETPATWGDNTYWAPEVKKFKGKYYMSYSCKGKNKANGDRMLLCLAISDSPKGPFTDLYAPWFDDGYSCIDSDIFFDSDSTPYLYFDKVGVAGYIYGMIYVRKLSATDLTIAGDTIKCIQASQPWENPKSWINRTNEGSFVFKFKGKYFMTYSANAWDDPNYGIGYATADSPLGPWTKSADNPIIHKDEILGIYGPGHSSMTISPDGKESFIVYHTLFSATNTQRNINIDRYYIDDDYNIHILGPTRSPQPMPSGAGTTIVNVESVLIDKPTASVAAGDTLRLSATVIPVSATIKDIFWTSLDPLSATVSSNGLVTTISPGKIARIVVSSYEGFKKDTCYISVTGKNVTGISLDKKNITMAINTKEQLIPIFTPLDATNKNVIWSSSNTAVATVSPSGLISALKVGSANIIATSADGSFRDTCKVTTVLKLANNNLSGIVSIYPNPVDKIFYLTGIPACSTIKIISLSGMIIEEENCYNEYQEINVADLATGQYIIYIINSSSTTVCKFFKQ